MQNEKANLLDNGKQAAASTYEEIKEAAENLYDHTKVRAQDIYEGSKDKIRQTQENFQEYSDEIIQMVKDKPITSLLIAGGIGFILSALLRK